MLSCVFASKIYLATNDGKIEKKLTNTPGYDAEGYFNLEEEPHGVHVAPASGDLDLWTMKGEQHAGKEAESP